MKSKRLFQYNYLIAILTMGLFLAIISLINR